MDKTVKESSEAEKNTPEKAEANEIEEIVLERDQEKEREYDIKFKEKAPILTVALIVINILVGALILFYANNSGVSYSELLIQFGAKENYRILTGEYWRFFTPIFLHASIEHLLINCYSLYVVGISIEKIFGRVRFIAVYILSGILGNVASFGFSSSPGVGASGAIFGLLGALLYFGLENPVLFKRYFGYNVLITILINLVYGFSTARIDNYAHMGGLVGGFLTSGIVSGSKKPYWYLNRYVYLVLTVAVAFSGMIYGFHNKQNQIIVQVVELEKLDQGKEWQEAEIKGEEILALEPGDNGMKASVLWMLIRAEASTGKYHEAVEHGKMLKEIDPLNGHYILGFLYFDMEQFDLSREELLAAKKAGANDEQIEALLREIEERN